jgi:hypothetical protein
MAPSYGAIFVAWEKSAHPLAGHDNAATWCPSAFNDGAATTAPLKTASLSIAPVTAVISVAVAADTNTNAARAYLDADLGEGRDSGEQEACRGKAHNDLSHSKSSSEDQRTLSARLRSMNACSVPSSSANCPEVTSGVGV